MKKTVVATWLLLTAFTLSACGSKTQDTGTGNQTDTSTKTETSDQTNSDAEALQLSTDTAWTSEGAYIDDQGNYLILVYYSEDMGMGQYGWTVSAIMGEEMYGGFMDEENGTLTGDIIAYDSDGSEKEIIPVTLTQDGDNVIMETDAGDVYTFTPDDTDYTAEIGDMLPMFQYQSIHAYDGFDNLWAATYNYLSFDAVDPVDPEHVLIPYANIVDVDDSDPDDVLVYGDYYVWEFEQNDDTLSSVSSAHIPGVIHMTQIGDDDFVDYYGFSMDQALTDDEVEEIFGEYYDHYLTLSSDEEMRDSGIAYNIADYVKANDLPITKYQIDDGEVKELPESLVTVFRESVDMPVYEYPDSSSKEYAIYQYLIQYYFEKTDTFNYDVIIPFVYIVGEDNSDSQDIVVMLTGWIGQYILEDDILVMQSGSEISGAIHLEKTDYGYEGTSFDEVLDGSEYEKSAKEIFGSYYNAFKDVSADDLAIVENQVIEDYVEENGLSISGYQDLGSDTVYFD